MQSKTRPEVANQVGPREIGESHHEVSVQEGQTQAREFHHHSPPSSGCGLSLVSSFWFF